MVTEKRRASPIEILVHLTFPKRQIVQMNAFARRSPFFPRHCEGDVKLATNAIMAFLALARTTAYSLVSSYNSDGAPNVLTLSCKSRPPCRLPRAARRLPRLTCNNRSELQPT
jgi:hypothetical protein